MEADMNLRKIGAVSLVSGILLLIMGAAVIDLRRETEAINVFARYINMHPEYSGLALFGIVICILGGMLVITGIMSMCMDFRLRRKSIVKKPGVVVQILAERVVPTAIVSFDDGSRRRLSICGGISLSKGDKGYFFVKGDNIIKYKRYNTRYNYGKH